MRQTVIHSDELKTDYVIRGRVVSFSLFIEKMCLLNFSLRVVLQNVDTLKK